MCWLKREGSQASHRVKPPIKRAVNPEWPQGRPPTQLGITTLPWYCSINKLFFILSFQGLYITAIGIMLVKNSAIWRLGSKLCYPLLSVNDFIAGKVISQRHTIDHTNYKHRVRFIVYGELLVRFLSVTVFTSSMVDKDRSRISGLAFLFNWNISLTLDWQFR